MTWQDVVIGIGQFVFTLALLPSIVSDDKPAKLTCLITAAMLVFFSFTYATLDMWLSSGSCALCGFCWCILLFQERP